MKQRWLIMVAIVVSLGVVVWKMLPDVVLARVGEPAMAFELPDLNDTTQALPEGDVVLLNFWASWCSPCRDEIPSMGELYKKYQDSGLKVVAISVDHERDMLESFVREYDIQFQVLQDPERAISHTYGVYRYPETFLIDRQGNIREHLVGAVDWMSAPVLDTVERLIREPAGGAKGVARDGVGAGNG